MEGGAGKSKVPETLPHLGDIGSRLPSGILKVAAKGPAEVRPMVSQQPGPGGNSHEYHYDPDHHPCHSLLGRRFRIFAQTAVGDSEVNGPEFGWLHRLGRSLPWLSPRSPLARPWLSPGSPPARSLLAGIRPRPPFLWFWSGKPSTGPWSTLASGLQDHPCLLPTSHNDESSPCPTP